MDGADGVGRVRGLGGAEEDPGQEWPDGGASPVSEGSGDESDPRGGGEGDHGTPAAGSDCEEEGEGLRPLPDRIVSDLTAWRTLALQDAFAQATAIDRKSVV